MSYPTRPAVYGLTISQGATFRLRLTWTDEDEQPIDLTGCDARLVISTSLRLPGRNVPTLQTILTLDNGDNGGITLGDSAGTIEFEIGAETTADIDWDRQRGQGTYDFYLTFPSTDVVRLLEGSVVLRRRLAS